MLTLRRDHCDLVQTFTWLCVLEMGRAEALFISKKYSLKIKYCQLLDTHNSFLLDTIVLSFKLMGILPCCSVETELSPWSSIHMCTENINILQGISCAMTIC